MERKSELEKIEKQKLEEAKKRVALIEKLTSVDLAVPTNEEVNCLDRLVLLDS